MALSYRFPITTQRTVFDLSAAPGLSEAARASAFARLAQKRILAVDSENDRLAGRDIPYSMFVDGAPAANLARVKSSSIIIARWSLGVAVIDHIWALLQESGPFLTGQYRASARMYIDGVETSDPRDAQGARRVLFLSTVPYARKIERGEQGYSPGHVYESVAQFARARYRDAATIKFTYAEPEGPAPALDAWASRASARRSRRGGDRSLRQPAILVLLQ